MPHTKLATTALNKLNDIWYNIIFFCQTRLNKNIKIITHEREPQNTKGKRERERKHAVFINAIFGDGVVMFAKVEN